MVLELTNCRTFKQVVALIAFATLTSLGCTQKSTVLGSLTGASNDASSVPGTILNSCNFNGQVILSGKTTTGYLTSSVAAGKSCTSQIRSCSNGILSGSYAFSSCQVGTTSPAPTPTPVITLPLDVLSVGYTHQEFYDDFSNSATIDWHDTKNPGYNWYVSSPGKSVAEVQANISNISTENYNGSSMLYFNSKGAFLQSVNINASKEVVGTSISTRNGGGAYYEARIAFGDTAATTSNGWPAFWLNPTSHVVNQDSKLAWNAANPDYTHYFELDIMEYFNNTKGFNPHINPRDWYGEWNVTCDGYCVTDGGQFVGPGKKGYFTSDSDPQLVAGATLNFHTYGALWVPATSTTAGYIQFFIDGVPAQGVSGSTKYTYTSTIPATPEEPRSPWKFKVADSAPMALILDTGANAFMYVNYVTVYQHP